jgi:hypothetical protein
MAELGSREVASNPLHRLGPAHGTGVPLPERTGQPCGRHGVAVASRETSAKTSSARAYSRKVVSAAFIRGSQFLINSSYQPRGFIRRD